MVIAGAEEAGEQAAIDAAKEAADQAAEEAFLDVIVQICEEEGRKKGTEIFGEFGGTVGVEAALLYGKKSGIAKVKEMAVAHAIELGKAAGKEAGINLRLIWWYTCVLVSLQLAPESHDLSQAEQIHKMTTIFTQNDNFVYPGQF